MTKEEVEQAHYELKRAISVVLDQGFQDVTNEDMHQAACIKQAVLCEFSSKMEYQTGRAAPFTTRQIDHICYQIGEWYMMMKPLLKKQHHLGFMKEKLKTMICGE